ncbi:MAG: hypothetical protein ICV60_21140 [Pyrinomonadaceae bacterium]|nr:hypothetical protein [Pyrinomonadaceae bacterium]
MKVVTFIAGLVIAAAGGVIAYRALFVHTGADFVISNTGAIHEVQNWWKATAGILMLLVGAIIAFLSARRRQRPRA